MKYTIGQFSKITGISIYTLRYYEKENLITPKRKENDRRVYNNDDITWIMFIKRLKETGMPIKEIQKYATLRAKGTSTLEERMNMLVEHRSILLHKISEMEENLAKLDDKIEFYITEINRK